MWSAGTAKSTILQILFLLLIIMRSGLLAGIRWSVCMLKSHRSLCVSFSRTGARLCIYHVFVWSNWNFLHISQWITTPTQSCLALYSFCANLLHSLIMWLIVSSLSPHSQHLLFCCVLSILALIWFVLTALSCAAIRRDSVSLLRFPFLNQVQVFWCEMLFIRRLKRTLLFLLSLLFSHFELMVFLRSLSDNKSPLVSWVFFLSFPADLNNNVMICMFLIVSLIFCSASFFHRSLRLFQVLQLQMVSRLLSSPTTFAHLWIYIQVIYIFSLSFIFTLRSPGTAKPTRW